MVTRVKIAVLGGGLIGREHVQLIERHPDATLAAIADISPEAGEPARRMGVPVHSDFERMLDEERPDGAIVALPNVLHLEAGLACIQRGIPVLVEKPIADTIRSALALVKAAEALGVPLLVGHHRRHSPDMRKARDLIARGELGTILAVNGMCLVRKHDSYFETEWRRQPGGGPLLINAIHDIDCLRFLCGEIESVQAITSSEARGHRVEDTAAIVLRFANGALGTFLLSDAVPSPFFWDTASGQALYFPNHPGDSYVIGGSKASLTIPGLEMWAHGPDGDWRDPIASRRLPIEHSSCYANQLDNLVQVIRGEAEPVVTGRDATMTLAATLAIDRAAASASEVRVAEMLD